MGIFKNIIDSVSNSFVNTDFEYIEHGERVFQTLDYNDIQRWKYFIKEKLIYRHYLNFNPKKLQMIVIGSSGIWNNYCQFNEALAMVQEGAFGYVPFTVQNLITNLDYAFNPHNRLQFPIPKRQNQSFGYDLQCSQLMKEVLFINVCLSTDNYNWCDAVCSIEFINELLRAEESFGNEIAILDFRLDMHTHFENDDYRFFDSESLNQDDNSFAIDPADYHYYYRFGHPAHIPSSNGIRISDKFIEMFRDIDDLGYPIAKMYKHYGCFW